MDYAACALLGTASSALVGRFFALPRRGYKVPLQLYQALCGESGTGKSPIMAKLFAPLQSWLQERNRPQPDASEVDYEPVVTDATPEALLAVMAAYKGRAVVYTDEGSIADILSGALYGKPGGRTNIDLFLKAYDGSAIACYRKNAVSNIMLDEVHLAVTIGMQPCVLDEFARNPTLASHGLPQRMLFYKPVPLTNVNVIDAPEEPTEELEAWAEKSAILQPCTGQVNWSCHLLRKH